VAQLHPRTLGSIFVASYESQGYGENILIRIQLVAGCRYIVTARIAPKTPFPTVPPIVASRGPAEDTFPPLKLAGRCLGTVVFTGRRVATTPFRLLIFSKICHNIIDASLEGLKNTKSTKLLTER
jgi:hypothetical protein